MQSTIVKSNILIRASAGTGKTFQLSNRLIRLLHEGADVDRILATTFTRKAAAEILDRVVLRLAEASLEPHRCDDLAQFVQSDGSTNDLDQERCQQLLEQLLRELHRVRIGTLDSFFVQIARSFSLELGLPANWQIVDEFEDSRLREEAIEVVLRENSATDLSRLLNLMSQGEAQRSITAMIRSTVSDLYEIYAETEPSSWEAIPRPRRLAEDKLRALLNELRDVPLPKDARFSKARQRDYEAAIVQDWESFLQRGLAKKVLEGQSDYQRKPIPPTALKIYRQLLQHARATLLHQLANQTKATYELIDRFDTAYQMLKYDSRGVRFTDITRQLARAIGTEDLPQIEYRLDSRIDHVLLDEFQDTSPPQWQVVRGLVKRISGKTLRETHKHRISGHQSEIGIEHLESAIPSAELDRDVLTLDTPASTFFCVGDVKQAIYGWRGGVAELLNTLDSEIPNLFQDTLSQSFRSSVCVIEAVNRIFTGLHRHSNLGEYEETVKYWCHNFPQHSTQKTDSRGYVCLTTSPASTPENRTGANPRVKYAARQVADLASQAPGRTIGVLTRRNAVVAELIYELRQLNVPASEEGGHPLTDSGVVETILSVLRIADHPGDTVARLHVARSLLGPIVSLKDHTDDVAASQLAMRVRRDLVERGYGHSISQWSDELNHECTPRERRRLEQLVERAYAYDTRATLRSTDFVRFIRRERVLDPMAADVRVMTVHQAKGLEFDAVVLPDLDDQLPGQPPACVVGRPSPSEPIDRVCIYRNTHVQSLLPTEIQQLFRNTMNREMVEGLCVLYVAFTRAIDALHVIISPSAKSERIIPRTAAGLVRAAMTDGGPLKPESKFYEDGDPDWHITRAEDRTPTPKQHTRSKPAIEEIHLAPRSEPRSIRLERISPSQMEGGHRISLGQIFQLDNQSALLRGTMVHAWFEQIRWLDDGLPEEENLVQIAARLGTRTLDVAAELTRFYEMLADPHIATLLRQDGYVQPDDVARRCEVSTEHAFAVRRDDDLLTGIIDRLVLIYEGNELVAADVIDFKTDEIAANHPDQLSVRVDHYTPQIEAYRFAVSETFGLAVQHVRAHLLFVVPGVVVPLHK